MVATLEKPETVVHISFTIKSSVLLRHVKILKAVVGNNPIVPILENILFAVHNDTVTLTTSDLQNSMICDLPVKLDRYAPDKIASFCIVASRLYKILSSLPEQDLIIDFYGLTVVTITAMSGKYNFHSEPAEDFPKLILVPNRDTVTISGSELVKGLAQTYPFTSTDDLRPAMTGINFDGNELAATDGHRLVTWKLSKTVTDASFIVPRKGANLLALAFGKSDEQININRTERAVCFSWANMVLTAKIIEERYPDYRNAIPTNNPISAVINRKAFITAIGRAKVFANSDTKQIGATFAQKKLTLTSNNDEQEDCLETLAIDAEIIGSIKIGFNAVFLTEVLQKIEGSHIQITMSTPQRAVVIYSHDEGKPNLKHESLVMPVMLNEWT